MLARLRGMVGMTVGVIRSLYQLQYALELARLQVENAHSSHDDAYEKAALFRL